MASNEDSWIADTIDDFIHSSIWLSPIHTFIDEHCACFDTDDDSESSSSLVEEQTKIHQRYRKLVTSLIDGLGDDLKLDKNALRYLSEQNGTVITDESYEQLYAGRDLHLFKEMMRRKNLILQLQALVNLRVQYGLLKDSDTDDDMILQLLLRATPIAQSSSRHPSRVPAHSSRDDRYRPIQSNATEKREELTTIDSVPEEVLREKLRQLTVSTMKSVNSDASQSAVSSRKDFLRKQRDLIVQNQRDKRTQALENEVAHTRPQSAAHVAQKAMETRKNHEQDIPNDELEKRRAIAAKLRRELVDRQ